MTDHDLPDCPDDLPPPICEYCGFEITELDQKCPALADGVCAP